MKLNISLNVSVAPNRVSDRAGMDELELQWQAFVENPDDFGIAHTLNGVHLRRVQYSTSEVILLHVPGHTSKEYEGEFVGYVTLDRLSNKLSELRMRKDHPFVIPEYRGRGVIRAAYEYLLQHGTILICDSYPSEAHNQMWRKLAQSWPFLVYRAGDDYTPKERRTGVSVMEQASSRIADKKYGAMLFGHPWTQSTVNDWARANRYIV